MTGPRPVMMGSMLGLISVVLMGVVIYQFMAFREDMRRGLQDAAALAGAGAGTTVADSTDDGILELRAGLTLINDGTRRVIASGW